MRAFAVIVVVLVGCAGGPAGPGSHPDGHGDDDGSDGSTPDTPTTPVTCGGTVCRTDQTCDAGVCKFGCVGATVPGDYATIQNAIDALAAANADATICLADAAYTEPTIYVRDTASHQKALKIVGLAMDRSRIMTDVYVLDGWKSLTVQGLQINVASNRTAFHSQAATAVSLVATKLAGGTAIDAYQRHELKLDGCEIAASGGYGISGFANTNGPLTIDVENTYFHGAANAYAVRMNTSSGFAIDLRFINNTIVDYDVGLDISGSTTALIANTIITGANTHALQWIAGTTVMHRNNALWNNTTNYAGLATDGAGYIKTDCMLDSAGKAPAPKVGSACRNAGDGAVAPNHDFFGAARAMPDIGAVEGP